MRLSAFLAVVTETYICCSKPPDVHLMSGLRNDIQRLLLEQENGLPRRLGGMSLDVHPPSSSNSVESGSPISNRRLPNRGSFERARPPHLAPQSPLSPSSGTFSFDFPPSAPDAPGSSLASPITSQSTASNIMDHWAKKVFLGDHSVTPIRQVGEW